MRTLALTMVMVAGCCSPAYAGGWLSGHVYTDKVVRGAVVASVVTHGLDVYTTSRGLERGSREMNPLLGDNPSDGALVLSKVVGMGLAACITEGIERSGMSPRAKLKWQRGTWITVSVLGLTQAALNADNAGVW